MPLHFRTAPYNATPCSTQNYVLHSKQYLNQHEQLLIYKREKIIFQKSSDITQRTNIIRQIYYYERLASVFIISIRANTKIINLENRVDPSNEWLNFTKT